jgi:tRNA (cmo5U34)-methyltransferase
VSEHFHSDPETYLERSRAAIPRFDELQDAAIDAVPGRPERILELGMGTGETTRRLTAAFPGAAITGLDSSPDVVFAARGLGVEVRLARMEDPLPDGPWDLVIAVLSVHHLTAAETQDLLRRVREQSGSLVIGDVVAVESGHRTRIGDGLGDPAGLEELLEWSGGELRWQADDLAVISAVYPEQR